MGRFEDRVGGMNMDVTAMSKMAYAMNQSAAKLPQAERV